MRSKLDLVTKGREGIEDRGIEATKGTRIVRVDRTLSDTSLMMNPLVIPATRASRLFFPFLTSNVSYLADNLSSSSLSSCLH